MGVYSKSDWTLRSKHGDCKVFSIHTVKRSAGTPSCGILVPEAPSLGCWAGLALQSTQKRVGADNAYLPLQCCFLQGTHLLCAIQ